MKITPIIAILVLSGLSFSQQLLNEGAAVNGVGLGATREQVIRKFGKPVSETKRDAGEDLPREQLRAHAQPGDGEERCERDAESQSVHQQDQ